jgi:WD40 repeat protein
VAWSPDGQVLASSGSGGSIRLWDAAAGQAIKVLTGHTGWVERIAWSPDGRAILSGGSYHDYTVRIWDVATGRICHTLTHHTGPVFGIAWLPDGQQFVSVGEDGLIQLCVLLATEKM